MRAKRQICAGAVKLLTEAAWGAYTMVHPRLEAPLWRKLEIPPVRAVKVIVNQQMLYALLGGELYEGS